jgi:chromosome segregation ATPase
MATPDLPDQAANTAIRIASLEQRVIDIQRQMSEYERSRENELKLQSLRDLIAQIRLEISELRSVQTEINTKITAQAMTQQRQSDDARSSQDRLQIRVLISLVSFIATILGGVLIYIITHLHP